ncbi:MAG: 50S ribosomal protein L18 [Candidatus Wildermuthbacteria bacterium RIFCSPLOWO2_01_FULL_48_29]|uniref:Large ribosomal subunit protein uL18 n=2 Tax=Candidatus Wildermuthiibacteriota TaxID=1817923 RepID=A0A1G2RNX2_9BACT|nr:MAG: 50S ribosomal protein L18 [Candidatus Wildermuthbacteria bacterium RIFCSPHIGHO2_01_FULL_48_27b]OHA74168.1 MAG: 50S ribosomal protein L18 [Candidatus Wildermuthbacteria bacterium RIFCSPLOWO2_01_FULL_48_29]
MTKETRKEKRMRRHRRIRARITGNAARPRLAVFRSNKHMYAQLIDDEKGHVLASFSDMNFKAKEKKGEISKEIGKRIAQAAKDQKIGAIVFDRSGYKYHGHVKVLAEEIRSQGIEF